MNKNFLVKKVIASTLAISFFSASAFAEDRALFSGFFSHVNPTKPSKPTYPASAPVSAPKEVASMLIGINYEGTASELSNCINDIDHVWNDLLTSRMHAKKDNLIYMSDKMQGTQFYPTKAHIVEQFGHFTDLVNQTKKGYFHYSGHGTNLIDRNGDEKDGYDEALVPVDYERSGFIVDDEGFQMLIKKFSTDAEVFMVTDCCHSGTILDLPYKWNSSATLSSEHSLTTSELNNLAKVVMLSGCKDSQTSADGGPITVDNEGSGALTGAFLAVLKKHNFSLTYRQLLLEVNQLLKNYGFTQRPELSSTKKLNLDELINFNIPQLALTH